MRYSQLFGKTSKTAPHDADSVNARLLVQAGFVSQVMAGVYSYLPLGLCSLRKIENIIREEMNGLGAQEVHLTGLQPKENWLMTDRWDKVDVLFKINSQTGKEYALGPTSEELVTPLVKQFVQSYRDLPTAVYQIQTKFRDELRAKSGILRGREFLMKDLYSFHSSTEDFKMFYGRAKEAYLRVFSRCGLDAKVTESGGGSFSDNVSHEFQVETPAGEDNLVVCRKCEFAQNEEISKLHDGDTCPKCGSALVRSKGAEVGNIFDLGDKFTKSFDFGVTGPNGERMDIVMGCYGIGISRLLGTIVEASHDEKGIVWPKSVAPYDVQLVLVPGRDEETTVKVRMAAEKLYSDLTDACVEVLYDDREELRAGEKFADADLIGLPLRIVVSPKTVEANSVEIKFRKENEARLIAAPEAAAEIAKLVK